MIDQSSWYAHLVAALRRADISGELIGNYARLAKVELGVLLLEVLQLRDQPVETLWVLLTNYPFSELDGLDQDQQKALAHVRHLIKFGRHQWRDAVAWYGNLPAHWRMFSITSSNSPLEREPSLARVPHRERYYREALTSDVPLARRPTASVAPGTTVYFRNKHSQSVGVKLDQALLEMAAEASATLVRLGEPRRERVPIQVPFAGLEEFTQWLATRDRERDWAHVIGDLIRYRKVSHISSGLQLGFENDGFLQVDGTVHIAGMVGAGKTTLAELLALYGATRGNWRTALIVGDTVTALSTADRLNRILGADYDTPVAVAMIGRTTREQHLERLAGQTPANHWAWRWLDTTCLIQGIGTHSEPLEPLPPGKEPCEALKLTSNENHQDYFACPLFSICPSRLLYQQLPTARIWVTTPGALAYSRLPTQLDTRRLSFAELVYHYADLAVFDEIDADQEQFDRIFAPEQWLMNADGHGLLQVLARSETDWFSRSTRDDSQHRWKHAFGNCQLFANHVSSLLDRHTTLRAWCNSFGFFGPLVLFRDLNRQLLTAVGKAAEPGSWDVEDRSLFWRCFWEFMEADKFKTRAVLPLAEELLELLREIASGGSLTGDYVTTRCRSWIKAAVAAEGDGPASLADGQLHDLAQRLELAISVCGLDFYTYVTLEEAQDIDWASGLERLRRAPPEFLGALPAPPFSLPQGFRYDTDRLPDDPSAEVPHRRLVMLRYQAIGRYLLMSFSDLRTRIGYPGPNVLAMSGTSWMPGSDTSHFDISPNALLVPSQKAELAIRQSEFHFSPQRDVDGKVVFVSGSGNMPRALRRVTLALAPHLKATMQRLQCLGRDEDALWRDRQRLVLFVNSYDQARLVAGLLGDSLPEWRDSIFFLSKGQHSEDELDRWVAIPRAQHISQPELASFATHERRRVLVAPLGAVGRRHNILNAGDMAAFGAVYFVIRPWPSPDDLGRWIRWLNWRALSMCRNPADTSWGHQALHATPTLLHKGITLRSRMAQEWSLVSNFAGYQSLPNDSERKLQDCMAATMAARIIQASGRLLRGGVPFIAHFVDGAWAPKSAAGEPDSADTSILLNMVRLLAEYCRNPIGQALYEPLSYALQQTTGLIAHDSGNG